MAPTHTKGKETPRSSAHTPGTQSPSRQTGEPSPARGLVRVVPLGYFSCVPLPFAGVLGNAQSNTVCAAGAPTVTLRTGYRPPWQDSQSNW